jgi:hypothetical protein
LFIGHFGVGFGAKAVTREVYLGTLFLATQFLDLLWPTLLLFDVERLRIVPGATAVTPLLFEYYPISHSLLAAMGWAAALAGAHFWLKKDRKAAIVLGLSVVSHWLLDLIVHQPDLPLYPGASNLMGFSVWSSLPATIALEVPLFAVGVWLYARTTTPTDKSGTWGLRVLVVFLLVAYAVNLFGPPPPSVAAIAWLGQLQWLLVIWGYWVDGHRTNA